jgi:hypothetical protein
MLSSFKLSSDQEAWDLLAGAEMVTMNAMELVLGELGIDTATTVHQVRMIGRTKTDAIHAGPTVRDGSHHLVVVALLLVILAFQKAAPQPLAPVKLFKVVL